MTFHFREVCIHGRLVRTCRCMGPKAERIVDCPPRCYAVTSEFAAQVDEFVTENDDTLRRLADDDAA
jgi:hypothetical protein